MINNLVEILKEIFTRQENLQIKPDLLSGKNLENFFIIIKTVLISY